MELLNLLQRYARGDAPAGPSAQARADGSGNGREASSSSSGTPRPHAEVWSEALDALLQLLAPLTPHVTAELWEMRHPDVPSVHLQHWPEADPELVRQDTVTMVIQVNGKVRDRIDVDVAISEADAEAVALASEKVSDALDGATPTRVVSGLPVSSTSSSEVRRGCRRGSRPQSRNPASTSFHVSGSIL